LSFVQRVGLTVLVIALLLLGLAALGAQARDPARECLPGMMQSDVGGQTVCWIPA
jgi:hypothetical protein